MAAQSILCNARALWGFADADSTLLAPYVQRWFDALHEQWADRSKEIAENMIKRSFPLKLTGLADEKWRRSDCRGRCVDGSESRFGSSALVRLVSEMLDSAHRAKRAQRRDARS